VTTAPPPAPTTASAPTTTTITRPTSPRLDGRDAAPQASPRARTTPQRGQAADACPAVAVEPMLAEDWPAVARIYRAGIATGTATFEREVPSWERWRASRVEDPCLVARSADGEVLGWAALSSVSSREVYRGVGAISIYVDPAVAGRGVGRRLLQALVERSEEAGFWTLQAGIFPDNEASVALHRACGFRLVGVRERVGRAPDGRWRDVALYERRSALVGAD
jgi:L-amino acid N-acyltransferase YncA